MDLSIAGGMDAHHKAKILATLIKQHSRTRKSRDAILLDVLRMTPAEREHRWGQLVNRQRKRQK